MQKSCMRLFIGLSLATHIILLIWLFRSPVFEPPIDPPLSTNIAFEQAAPAKEPEAPKNIVEKLKSLISPRKKIVTKRQQKATTSNKGTPQEELIYAQKLQAFLEKGRSYPLRALRLKQEGVVKVLLVIAKDGSFKKVSLLESSKAVILDQYTLNMIRDLKSFAPLPDQNLNEKEFDIPISYKIKK